MQSQLLFMGYSGDRRPRADRPGGACAFGYGGGVMIQPVRYSQIPSRLERFCLRFEWAALPCGLGMIAVTPINIIGIIDREFDLMSIAYMISVLFAIMTLAIGIWCPNHRRLGLQRNSIWGPPT